MSAIANHAKHFRVFEGEFTPETALKLIRDVESERLHVTEIVISRPCRDDMLRSADWTRLIGIAGLHRLHEGRMRWMDRTFLVWAPSAWIGIGETRRAWLYTDEGLWIDATESR